MRRAAVLVNGRRAGILVEQARDTYEFHYDSEYDGAPVSLTMPVTTRRLAYEGFPPFFDGLLPEGPQLESLLKLRKLDRTDYMGQLLAVGADMVGAVTVEAER